MPPIRASLSVGYLGAALIGDVSGSADLGLSILRMIGLVSTLLLFLSIYGQLSQRSEAELDEREVQLRNRAYVLTHQVMVGFLFLAFFYFEAAAKLDWWLPAADQVGNLISAFALGSMALPAAILAWRWTLFPINGSEPCRRLSRRSQRQQSCCPGLTDNPDRSGR